MKLKEYVETKYPDALNAIRHSESAKDVTELTDYEKAIIYKYTDDGYVVNETLRHSKGVKVPEFANHLNTVLAKLPPLSDGEVVVYRGIFKTNFVLNQYKKALNEKNYFNRIWVFIYYTIKKSSEPIWTDFINYFWDVSFIS